MRPLKLMLKGFKGIRSGMGLDEFTLDLTETGDGLIAIVGDNGKGKSTILGNLHPFRIMPDKVKVYTTRAFDIYNETYGRDARKELDFQMSGKSYRSILLIDAEKRKSEAYLYEKVEGEWVTIPSTKDGKLDPYDEAIESIIGTPRMFFTSIFRAQKAPGMSTYARKDMMDIFTELLCIDEIKEKSTNAGTIAELLTDNLSLLYAQKSGFDEKIKAETTKLEEILISEDLLKSITINISDTDGQIKAADNYSREIDIALSLQEEAKKRQTKITADITVKGTVRDAAQKAVEEKQGLYSSKYALATAKVTTTTEVISKAVDLALTSEVRVSCLLNAINAIEDEIKSMESSIREIDVAISLQEESKKRQVKVTADIAVKETALSTAQAAMQDKRALYNAKHKAVATRKQAAADLAAKSAALDAKAIEEAQLAAQLAETKERFNETDQQLTDANTQLAVCAETGKQIKEAEGELQRVRLEWSHIKTTAENNLASAQKTAGRLKTLPCGDSDSSRSCDLKKDAVEAKDSLPALEDKVLKAQVPDPREYPLISTINSLSQGVEGKDLILDSAKSLESLKISLSKEIKEKDQALVTLREALAERSQVMEANRILPDLEKEVADILEEGKQSVAESLRQVTVIEEEIKALRAELDAIVIDQTLTQKKTERVTTLEILKSSLMTRSQALEAERVLPELEKEVADLHLEGNRVIAEALSQVTAIEEEIKALETELAGIVIDETLTQKKEDSANMLESLRKSLSQTRQEETTIRIRIATLAEELKQIEEAKAPKEALQSQISKMEQDITEWRTLENALGEIIPLEIEDAGPTVTGITNDILHSCYGPRFSVSIRTQEDKVNGKGVKDTFDILVYDSLREESKSLSDMSGGEETWIDDAITHGISLFNASRSGKHYHCLFSDEKDGKLTEERRKAFLSVKRKVLELGGFDNEIFVSHTVAIQELADEKIVLN